MTTVPAQGAVPARELLARMWEHHEELIGQIVDIINERESLKLERDSWRARYYEAIAENATGSAQ